MIWAGGSYAFGRFENGAWREVAKEKQEGRRCHAIVDSVTESAVPITVALLRSACSRP